MLEALISTVIAEAGNEDELGQRLVIAVLFSRWKHYGEDFKKVFVPGQIAYRKDYTREKYSDKAKWDKISSYVQEMFTNTPIPYLVGKTTVVTKPVNIWNCGQVTSQMTSPITITKDMVTKLYMYCTTDGYAVTNPRPNALGPLNSKGEPYLEKHPEQWRNCEYILHHKGHVFTSGPNKGQGRPHYGYGDNVESKTTIKPQISEQQITVSTSTPIVQPENNSITPKVEEKSEKTL